MPNLGLIFNVVEYILKKDDEEYNKKITFFQKIDYIDFKQTNVIWKTNKTKIESI
ncbi:TPA: hypothetical protein N2D16_002696 [Clostridium botulinum]|nr:hypothetical protein [Clostridium botulinum]